MLYHHQSDDYRPLFWLKGRAVYANTLIIAGHVAAFVIAAFFMVPLGSGPVVHALSLYSPAIWRGEVWRLFSYIAFDPADFGQRSIWLLISILLLYFFGREVEQFVGRKTYLKFYAALIIIPAVLLALVGLFYVFPPYLNCGDVIFGVFVAFATIYPGAMPSMWVALSARTVMWILLGLFTLIDMVGQDYASIFMLWACSAVSYTGMRLIGAGSGSNWLADWLEERRMRRLTRKHQFKVVEDRKATESIDAILDKISKQGVGSLDARERDTLERARAKLLKRDQS